MLKSNRKLTTVLLLATALALLAFNIQNAKSLEVQDTSNIVFDKETNTVYLDSLTLKQKIGQMFITWAEEDNKEELQKMLIGGIYVNAKPSKEDFITTIDNFQEGTTIPFFVATDMEGGCSNPFEYFQDFPDLVAIGTKEEAYRVGHEQGKLLKEVGFNLNFAPVVELEDTIWYCRNFKGTPEEISQKASAYITGIQENVLATAKHYPGKTLVYKDPHRYTGYAYITQDDLIPFEGSIQNDVSAVMISHVITRGAIDSEGKPAIASKRAVTSLRNQFNGLIITDDTRMAALQNHYSSSTEIYLDLFKADNDLILYFNKDTKELYYIISNIEKAIQYGAISEDRIDKSVTRILKAKGIKVK